MGKTISGWNSDLGHSVLPSTNSSRIHFSNHLLQPDTCLRLCINWPHSLLRTSEAAVPANLVSYRVFKEGLEKQGYIPRGKASRE